MKAFFLRSGTRQDCPLLPLLFNITLEILARAIGQQKEIKSIPIGKEKVKWSHSQMTWFYIYRKSQRVYKKATIIEIINEFNKVAVYKVNTQNSVVFLYTSNEESKKEISLYLQFHL